MNASQRTFPVGGRAQAAVSAASAVSAAVAVVAALSGCAGRAPQGTAAGGGGEPRSVYFLTRCGFQTDGLWHHVDSHALLSRREAVEMEGLCERAEALLASGAANPGGPLAPGRGPSEASRSYEVSALLFGAPDAHLEIEILDPARGGPRLEVLAGRGEARARFTAETPRLAFFLRQRSLLLLATCASQELHPHRRALSWHGPALARFLQPGALEYPEDWGAERSDAQRERILRAVLFELRRLEDSRSVETTVRELLPAIAVLSRADLAPLARDERTAVRLLHLAAKAWDGDREALDEILTLSLEYAGDVSVFGAAARSLVPEPLNRELHAGFPAGPRPESDVLFLAEVRRRISTLVHEPAGGWRAAAP
jgi:hypothetical protein